MDEILLVTLKVMGELVGDSLAEAGLCTLKRHL